ncbi:hypothetical protein BSKO_13679 [Bryopsis sp. KO-2023]|nr:hypothetical protein BSKO_13679 [Bryopsis sp. KO-2023]
MSEILEDAQQELGTGKSEFLGYTSEPKGQDWQREGDAGAWPGSGGPSEIMEDNPTPSGRDYMNSMNGSFLTDPGLPSGSSLYPSDVGNSQKPGVGWMPGHSPLTLENVDRVNRLGGQTFVDQSNLTARLAWGNRPVTPIRQLATPRSQLDPVLENVNYSGPLARHHPSYRPPDSPRSRGGRSIESRDTFGSMSIKEYRDSVYELSQNPWGADVQRAVVTHAPRSIAPRDRRPGRMPRIIKKRYKDTFTSTSERVARFTWGVLKNFWSWFAVIAIVAAREGFREESLANQGTAYSDEHYSNTPQGWDSNHQSSGEEGSEDSENAEVDEENVDARQKENLTAQSFMG